MRGTGRERLKREGIYVYVWMIDHVVREKRNIAKQLHSSLKNIKRNEKEVSISIYLFTYICVCVYVSVFHLISLLILPQLRKTPKISLDGWCRT